MNERIIRLTVGKIAAPDALYTGSLGSVDDSGKFVLENVSVRTLDGEEQHFTAGFIFDFDEVAIAAVYN